MSVVAAHGSGISPDVTPVTKGRYTVKQGRSLQELAAELERQRASRKDYLAHQGKLDATVVDGEIAIDGINGQPFPLTDFAFKQVTDHLGIPAKYADRMKAEQPQLLVDNINTWLHADSEDKRMVRTLDGRVRAFLSSKYRPLDNYELAQTVLPALLEQRAEIMSSELTETRMFIKAILPGLSEPLPEGLQYGAGHENIRVGDRGRVVSAIVISNSDVGAGTLRIEPSVFSTWCTNLAVMVAAAMKKYHVGRAFDADEDFSIYRDETRRLNDAAFWAKVKDVTATAFNPDTFKAAISLMKDASARKIEGDLVKITELVVEEFNLPTVTQNGILTALARGGDLSQLGLSNAVTYVANDPDGTLSYEAATQLERVGGQILALPPAKFEDLAKARRS